MAVPSSLVDLSTTAASNSPAGSESIGTSLDDYLRAVQAIIKQGVSKGSDIASASTITPVATSAYFVVTGTTGITAIGETYSWTGRIVVLKFSGSLLLTHSSGLLLPGAANITTVAGDVLAFVNESAGVWRCIFGNNALLLTGGTLTGALIFKAGLNNKASAATVDITSLGANTAHITGTTGIGAWTMTSGQVADVVFDAAPLLGHHATTFNLPGGANILAAAGDRMRLWYDGTTVWCVSYQRADGTPVVGLATALKSATTSVDVSAATAPSAGQVLKATSSTAATWQSAGGITLGTPTASTSGSAIGFTGIPAGTKRITVNFKSVSTNGTAVLQIQIGDSGGYENSGYTGGAGDRGGEVASSTGFTIIRTVAAAGLYSGSVVLSLEDSSDFTWAEIGVLSLESTGQSNFSSGVKSLSAELDRIQVITTDTFDAGEINISYE